MSLKIIKSLWRLLQRIEFKAFYALYFLDPRLTVMIGLTYFCQCNCSHCAMANFPKNKQEELSKRELTEIIRRFPRNKIRTVYFFGGEPLLRDNIFELINLAHKRGFITRLDTNGLMLNQEMAKKLKNAGLDLIGISIDSPYPQVHNKLRGAENVFEKAMEGVKNCLNQKIRCLLSTYATKENIRNGDLEKIISLGEKLGVGTVRILHPLAIGRWSESKNIQLNQREEQLLEKICHGRLAYLEGKPSCTGKNKELFYISPYGDIQPCCYIPLSFGNLREEPLSDILKRMWQHPMFKIGIKNECPINNKEFQKKYLYKISPDHPLLNMKE